MDSNPTISTDDNAQPTQKRAKQSPKIKLEEFIAEAVQLAKLRMPERVRRSGKTKHVRIVPHVWPAWPYWDIGPVSSAVSKELGEPEETVSEIEWRLQRFRYPYRGGRGKKPKTFYERAEILGILDALLEPPLLSDIRSFWWFQKYNQRELELEQEKKSEYGLPMAFHRQLLFQLTAHLSKVDRIAGEHERKKDEETRAWFERFYEYRRATLKQILSEAAIVYPQVQYRLTPAAQLTAKAEKLEAEVALFSRLDSVLKGEGVKSHKFAYHLTSLFCTPRKIISQSHLRPTPETIRRNIEVWMKKHPDLGSGKTRKTSI
jgi:hypothetical protein